MDFNIIFFIISSVIGSGIFFIPYNLQNFGINSFISLFLISFLFGNMGYLFTKIHNKSIFEFIEDNLGLKIGFFTTFLYWFVSWSSTIVVISEIFRYFINIFPIFSSYPSITQVFFTIILILINCYKNNFTKYLSISINIIKIVPLIVFPVICFYNYKFQLSKIIIGDINIDSILQGFPKVVWCFLGIECGAIINKKKTITKSMIVGIILVSIIYIINMLGIFGILGYNIPSYTVYSDVINEIFGNNGVVLLSIIIFIISFAGANSWILSGSELTLEMSNLNYFSKYLQKQNKSGAYYLSTLVSSIGLIPLCFFSSNKILCEGVDLAGLGFLIFYFIFCLSYFKKYRSIIALFSLLFCSIIFFYILSFKNIFLILFIIIIGIPIYTKIKKS